MTKLKNSQRLSSAEVAQMLGVTKTTLKTWLRAGKIPEPERDPSNDYRIWTLQEVDQIRQKLREEGK
jgi:excisionase family DNA binding protein